jgi:uncharacterized protein (UPF0276 family)|tara:strand:+ start:1370 stop:2224 length:855 start_codon:yes stop_codon:yes gene_type:complete
MTTQETATLSDLPVLGVGMGYRGYYAEETFNVANHIDFLEIIPDHFLGASHAQKRQLERLISEFTLVPHGLSLSLGSADGLNKPYLRQIRNLVKKISPPWWSEHISFTQADGVEIGHLSPTPFNQSALDVLVENTRIAQDEIETPLILENITYTVKLPWNDIPEEDFIAELLDRTGCGLLLDVTNLYINSKTHGYDPIEWLKKLPSDKVIQLHFVGYEVVDDNLVDSHSQSTNESVWSFLETVLEMFPVKGAILERDKNLPPINEITDELDRLRKIGQTKDRWN